MLLWSSLRLARDCSPGHSPHSPHHTVHCASTHIAPPHEHRLIMPCWLSTKWGMAQAMPGSSSRPRKVTHSEHSPFARCGLSHRARVGSATALACPLDTRTLVFQIHMTACFRVQGWPTIASNGQQWPARRAPWPSDCERTSLASSGQHSAMRILLCLRRT